MLATLQVSWFAVGCYYLMQNQNETARQFLSKATNLDRAFGPAWLAFGHSFAAEKEHDQAMAAYFTAFNIMKGWAIFKIPIIFPNTDRISLPADATCRCCTSVWSTVSRTTRNSQKDSSTKPRKSHPMTPSCCTNLAPWPSKTTSE